MEFKEEECKGTKGSAKGRGEREVIRRKRERMIAHDIDILNIQFAAFKMFKIMVIISIFVSRFTETSEQDR